MNNLYLPFDQYTRNVLIEKLINEIYDSHPLRILDVGGRAGHLSDFLTQDTVFVTDILLPEVIPAVDYLLGDITCSPFKDDSFDIVVSTDVYEHIPPQKRQIALSEMLRISKNHVILAAPFYSKEIEDAEKIINEFHFKINGKPHPWLEEHKNNILPSEPELDQFLSLANYDFYKIGSNSISVWVLFQSFLCSAFKYQISEVKIREVFRYYNENFITLGDNLEPTYRKVYLIGKKGTLPGIDFNNTFKIDRLKLNYFYYLIIDLFSETIKLKDLNIDNITSTLHNNDNQINQMADTIRSQESRMNQMADTVISQESQINRMTDTIRIQESLLHQIQDSITMRWLNRYQIVIEKVLPSGTKRRSFYEMILRRLRQI